MVSRGKAADDVSYVLLDASFHVPRLDLTDCRPTELPILREVTPTRNGVGPPQGSGRRGEQHVTDASDVPILPRANGFAPSSHKLAPKSAVTEIRHLVVDMTELDKTSPSTTNTTTNRTNNDNFGGGGGDDDDGCEEILIDPNPNYRVKRNGGVLKGGEAYVRSEEQRPRPRVSFLLDTLNEEGDDRPEKIRVFAKPPQVPHNDSDHPWPCSCCLQRTRSSRLHSAPSHGHSTHGHVATPTPHRQHPNQQHHRQQQQQQRPPYGPHHAEAVLANGVPVKKFRPHATADSRSAYRDQIKLMQAEATRLRDAYVYTTVSRSTVKPPSGDDPSRSLTSTPQLPSVPSGQQSVRRTVPFSFKKHSSADSRAGPARASSGEERRRSFLLPNNGKLGVAKGSVRFQDEEGVLVNGGDVVVEVNGHGGGGGVGRSGDQTDYDSLYCRHVEPRGTSNNYNRAGSGSATHHNHHRSNSQPQQHNHGHHHHQMQENHQSRALGTYSASDHPPRAASKPPIPYRPQHDHAAHTHDAPPYGSGHNNQARVNSAGSRSSGGGGSKVREWLSADTVPDSTHKSHKPRPSTVSSASSSVRSRDAHSAKQRMGEVSSRASSASLKAASDPGVSNMDLDRMDPVTLNLMARTAKGPNRYRFLAKLRSLNLNS